MQYIREVHTESMRVMSLLGAPILCKPAIVSRL